MAAKKKPRGFGKFDELTRKLVRLRQHTLCRWGESNRQSDGVEHAEKYEG
jgi:hypothetical protein